MKLQMLPWQLNQNKSFEVLKSLKLKVKLNKMIKILKQNKNDKLHKTKIKLKT